jgi:hypothetical protein
MDSNFLPFDEARKYVKSLKLKSQKGWTDYCKSGKRPSNIPSRPESVYLNKGWDGYSNWVGNKHGKYLQKGKGRWSFEKSREYVRKLNIKGLNGWNAYCKSGNRLPEIPASPHTSYRHEGWEGYGDWTGTGNKRSISFLPFEEARRYVQNLKIKNQKEFLKWSKSKQRPSNIPTTPERTYRKEWKGWGDWLHISTIDPDLMSGTSTNLDDSLQQVINNLKNKYLDYNSAKNYVQNLKIKNQKEWFEYCKSGERPEYISGEPWSHYDEWISFSDWLGTTRIRPTEFLSFEEARNFVHSLKLQNKSEWEKWVLTDKKPLNIPAQPSKFYLKSMDWTNWTDWLDSKPSKNYGNQFTRRSVSRIDELKKLNYSKLDIIQKLSQEYQYISISEIEYRVKILSKDHS